MMTGTDYQMISYMASGACCIAIARSEVGQAHSPRPGPTDLLVWGVFCQGGSARVLSIFIACFLVRSESTVSSFRPRGDREGGARKSSQGWARYAHTRKGFVLDGSEPAAKLCRPRDDD